MKKEASPETEDELRPEYDLNTLLKGGVRGKYADREGLMLSRSQAPASVDDVLRRVDEFFMETGPVHDTLLFYNHPID
ncbi:MAG: hypothetical protein L0229_24705 [Blastocatellia bacterium]|nr:hypothetical protein [Blastocatellia bacterium]